MGLTEDGGHGENHHHDGEDGGAQASLRLADPVDDGTRDLGRLTSRDRGDLGRDHVSDGVVIEDSAGPGDSEDHDRSHRDQRVKGDGGTARRGLMAPPGSGRRLEKCQDRMDLHS